jgi:hypothetical protein
MRYPKLYSLNFVDNINNITEILTFVYKFVEALFITRIISAFCYYSIKAVEEVFLFWHLPDFSSELICLKIVLTLNLLAPTTVGARINP